MPKSKYPFLKLKVGQGFYPMRLNPGIDEDSARGMLGNVNKRLKPLKFASKKTKDGLRIYRVK